MEKAVIGQCGKNKGNKSTTGIDASLALALQKHSLTYLRTYLHTYLLDCVLACLFVCLFVYFTYVRTYVLTNLRND